ncbi:MAG TPA: hypothetical protein VKY37_00770, partial [Brumimicrobium sp.]|nr:hypothetical protein [Brumimicrobium sp.]
MKKIISLFTILLSASFVFGQITISDPDNGVSNPLDCSNYNDTEAANFIDGAGNYPPAMNETITICPDIPNGGPKLKAVFNNNPGFVWDVHSSDTLYVYDGPSTSSPLIGKYNNGTDMGGFSVQSSWANTTGCLTFKFVSDGLNQGAGWEANLICLSPPQDIEIHIEGFINGTAGNDMLPLDSGYVDVCQGDSVLFVAKPYFPYSQENTGNGYSQNVNNVSYLWEFSDGSTGPDNDSVWFKPPNQGGYLVDLRITDAYPSNTAMRAKVRVGTTPSFVGAGILNDTICFNQNTSLAGGVTTTDTVGMDIPLGGFQMGGTFAGLTYLPDGNDDVYSTSINMTGFPPGSTVTNAGDIVQMCVDMEHSFLGDLEMWLACPDGTEVTIFNSSDRASGHIPGGFAGGSRFLGEPIKATGTGPGNGYEYCFSSTINNWGPFATTYTTNTIPTPPSAPSSGSTMNPNGIYAPEDSYAGFNGCPLNGNWTLYVKDTWGIDDGYIFEWGIYFDPTLFPDNESYQNTIEEAYWSYHPTIVSDTTNDTLVVVVPDEIGNVSYTLNVIDDFGCAYDTVIKL